MAEGSYREKAHADVAAAIIEALQERKQIPATEIEDYMPYEVPAQLKKQVPMSLQKQGLIRFVGSRRKGGYTCVASRRIVFDMNSKAFLALVRIGGPLYAQTVLHNMDGETFPPPSNFWVAKPKTRKHVVDLNQPSLGLDE